MGFGVATAWYIPSVVHDCESGSSALTSCVGPDILTFALCSPIQYRLFLGDYTQQTLRHCIPTSRASSRPKVILSWDWAFDGGNCRQCSYPNSWQYSSRFSRSRSFPEKRKVWLTRSSHLTFLLTPDLRVILNWLGEDLRGHTSGCKERSCMRLRNPWSRNKHQLHRALHSEKLQHTTTWLRVPEQLSESFSRVLGYVVSLASANICAEATLWYHKHVAWLCTHQNTERSHRPSFFFPSFLFERTLRPLVYSWACMPVRASFQPSKSQG